MTDERPPRADSARACLARLYEMGPLGAEARRRVHAWLTRLGAGDSDLGALTDAMTEISRMMDALTARLLLVPWDGHPPNGSLKS